MCPEDCFDAYLRQSLSYFDVVRDPLLAEIALLIVRQPAGNGGIRFTVTPSRVTPLGTETSEVSRSFVADPGASVHAMREALLAVVLRTLYAELLGTPHEQAFTLTLPARDGESLSTQDDPWDYWVFAPEVRGASDGGEGYYYAEITGALTIRRITAPSKLRLRGAYERVLNGFLLEDGARVRGDVQSWTVRTLYAHSLGEHLSLGTIVVTSGSQFENTKGHLHVGAVLEANAFPFAQNARRQLRVAYQIGAWSNWYEEQTVFARLREHRAYHALALIADVNQPWGSVQWVTQANQLIDAPKRYRLRTGLGVTLRLVAGLAISLDGEAAYVRDLITLRERPITDTELLLWTTQQATRYTFDMNVAITYTFGSVLNTIVNPRFERIDLESE